PEIINVHSPCREELHSIPAVPCPSAALLRFGRFGAHTQAHEAVFCIPLTERGGLPVYTPYSAPLLVFDQPVAHRRGRLGTVAHHYIDRLITDCFKKARLPVILEPKGIKSIDQLLSSRVRDGADLIHQQRSESPQGFNKSFSFGECSTVANDDPHDWSSVRQANEDNAGSHLVRRRNRELAVELEDLLCLLERIRHDATQHRADCMELVIERGGDAKVSATAPDAPE